MAQYGPYNGDFLNDYSNISAAGSAFKGFFEGMQTAEDRNMKKQEFDARMKSEQTKAQRDALEMKLKARTQGFEAGADGNLTPAQLTPAEQSANKLKAFGEGAKESGYDQYGNPTGYVPEPNSPKMIAARNSGMKFQTGEDDKREKEWQQFAEKITNPSSRSAWGRYQQNIDKGAALNVLAKQIGMPEGQQAPDKETREQMIARLNKADPRQLYEFAKAADQLTSNANSTVYGTDHLMPKDMALSAAKLKEYMPTWMGGGRPAEGNAGEFILRYLDSANREGQYYKGARDRALNKFTIGYEKLKKADPSRWERLLQDDTPQVAQFNGVTTADPKGLVAQEEPGLLTRAWRGLVGGPAQASAPVAAPHPQDQQAVAAAKAVLNDPKSPPELKAKAQAALRANGL